MALLWMDGFDHYNGIRANIDRVYDIGHSEVTLSNVNPRTGTYALRGNSNNARTIQFGVGGSPSALGVGVSFLCTTLPALPARMLTLTAAGSTIDYIAHVFLLPNGGLRVTKGAQATSTQIGSDSLSTITLDSYFHVEILASISGGNITVELRINGDTEITGSVSSGGLTDVSTIQLILTQAGQMIDDLFVWDTTGSRNNTFLGPKRVITLAPSANTATANWTGSYTDITTDDGDTTTITAGTGTPVVSEFELTDLPAGVSGISAVQTVFVAKTTSDGSAEVQASLLSGASTAAGDSHLIETNYDGYYDVHEVDPNTSNTWSVSAVNATKLRLSRTS